jgi:hypothetical protein
MARFYGEIRGHRGRATRIGHRAFRAHIRGWNVSVEVSCRIVDGRDVIESTRPEEVTPRVQRGSSRQSRSTERRMRPNAEVPPQREARAARLHKPQLENPKENAPKEGQETDGSVWNSSTPHAQACGAFDTDSTLSIAVDRKRR